MCYETTRIYQTGNGNFPREVIHPVSIGGVNIEKDTVVATQSFAVHFNPAYYENPSQFIPERWIDGEGKIKSPLPLLALFIVSVGLRY